LALGFVYGFAQPAAFEAVLLSKNYPADHEALAYLLILLALLKVAWASVVTRFFFTSTDTSDLIPTRGVVHELAFFKNAPKPFLLFPLVLVAGALGSYFIFKPVSFATFVAILVAVAAIVGGIRNGLDLFERYRKWRLQIPGATPVGITQALENTDSAQQSAKRKRSRH
jgi:hypothetical protein